MKRTSLLRSFSIGILVSLWVQQGLGQATIQQVLNNGPTGSRINIVFLSDGYTSGELTHYVASDVPTALNYLLSMQPYHEYASCFNAFAISVASNQSGADHPLSGIYRDTYFSSTYDSYGVERLITIPPNDHDPNYAHGMGRVDSLLQLLMPEYDIIVLLVNDPEYGGSGGWCAITSTNGSAPEIVAHELGHSFGALGDEYSDYTPGYSGYETPNTTAETDRYSIKWHSWIDDQTPVPTPPTSQYAATVGLFEGACYEPTGWYRPKLNCKMRALGVPYCEVCREDLLRSIYSRIRPIDSHTPIATSVSLPDPQTATFGITPIIPATHSLSMQWCEDGQAIAGATGQALEVAARSLGNGVHRLTAEVADGTPFVRSDPSHVLQDSVSWTVTVTGVTFSPPLLAYPPDEAMGLSTTLTFSWYPAPSALSYRLQIATDERFRGMVIDTTAADTFRQVGPLANGMYYWRVAAIDSAGPSAPSPARSLTTVLGQTLLVRPVNGVHQESSNPRLVWRHTSGAASYHLQVSADSLFSAGLILIDDPNVSDTSRIVGPLGDTTAYFWRVSGWNASGTGPYSDAWSFVTGIAVPDVPQLVAPENGAMMRPVHEILQWHSARGATSYHVQVATDSLFTAPVDDPALVADTVHPVPVLLHRTTYFWHVAAVNAAGTSRYSDPWQFTTNDTTCRIILRPGWNLVSVPMESGEASVAALFPRAHSRAYAYNGSSYEAADTLAAGPGYWIKSGSGDTVFIQGKPVLKDTVLLRSGWNLIGSVFGPVDYARLKIVPIGVPISPLFAYTGKYEQTLTDEGGSAYWIKASALCKLILLSAPEVDGHQELKMMAFAGTPPPPPDEPKGGESGLPLVCSLDQNYPNPFNPVTKVSFVLGHSSLVSLKVYDVLGQEVATLVDEVKAPGNYSIVWDAADVAGGVYFYRLEAGSFVDVKKMVLLR